MSDLRELRRASGLTQLELATRAGIDRTKISLAENGYMRLCSRDETVVQRALVQAIQERAALLQGVLSGAQAVSARA